MTSHILRNPQPLLFHTGREVQDFQTKHSLERIGDPAQSWMGVPLIVGGKIVGVMAIQNYERENLYSRQDLALFSTVATQAAISIQNARLFTERQARITEMAILTEIGQALSSALELSELVETVYRQVGRIFDTTNFYIVTYVEGSNDWTWALRVEYNERKPAQLVKLGSGITSHILRTRRPVLLNTSQEYNDFVTGQGIPPVGEPAKCWMGAPLLAGGTVVGVMAIQSYDKENLYSNRDLALFSTVASQAATAIQNVRLFEEAQTRSGELAVLNEMSRALTSMLDAGREAVVESLYQHASRLIDTTNFFIALCMADDEVSFPLVFEHGQRCQWPQRQARQGLTEHVIHTRESLLIEENVSERLKELNLEVIGEPALSWLGVPMTSGEKVIGVIAAQSYTTPRLYNEHRRDLLSAIASQAAIALQNAYLFQDSQRRVTEMAILNDIGRELVSALRLEELYRIVHQQVGRLFDTTSFFIGTYKAGSDHWQMVYRIEKGQPDELGPRSLKAGLGSYIVRTQKSLMVNSAQELADFFRSQNIQQLGLPDTKAWMGVPLIAAGQVVGVMAIQSYERENLYSDRDLALFSTIAVQVATTLQNARLFEEARTRAGELAVLNEMSRTLTSMLDAGREAVVESLYQYASRLIDTTNFFIALYTAENDEVSFPLAFEHGQRRQWAQRQARQGLTEHVIHTREALLIEENVSERLKELNIESIGEPALSWLGVPMTSGAKVIGMIAAQSYTTPRLYDERRRDLLSAVASQAAIALQNARLFEEGKQRAQQLETINEIGRTITSTLDPDALLRQIVDTTKAHFGLYYASIFLIKDHYLVLQEGTTVGRASARPERGLVKLDLDGPGLTTLAVRTDQPVLVNDVRSDPRYVFVPEMADALSEMTVPIKVKGRVIGVLEILSDQLSAFDQADARPICWPRRWILSVVNAGCG